MRHLSLGILTFTLLFFSWSQSSAIHFGGMDAGGSEHGVVCFGHQETANEVKDSLGNISDNQLEDIESVTAIDLFLARLPVGLPPRTPLLQTPMSDEDEFQFLARLLNKLDLALPPLGKRLRDAEQAFQPHDLKIKWVPISLQILNDSGLQIQIDRLPLCAITMLAWQVQIEGAHFLQLDPRLYDRMDTLNRTVTWLHEYVYWIARQNGQTNSRATRELVALLLLEPGQVTVGRLAHMAWQLGFISENEAQSVEHPQEWHPLF